MNSSYMCSKDKRWQHLFELQYKDNGWVHFITYSREFPLAATATKTRRTQQSSLALWDLMTTVTLVTNVLYRTSFYKNNLHRK